MKVPFCLMLCIIAVLSDSNNDCPAEICNAVYNGSLVVLRADDGDVITPTSDKSCSKMNADCMDDSCHACKCPSDKDTFDNRKGKCDNFGNKADIVYSREGLSVDTVVSTVYFEKNTTTNKLELRSVATNAVLPLVALDDGVTISNCVFDSMKVKTMHENDEEISYEGYTFAYNDGKGFIEINPNSIKIQPEYLQGQLIVIKFKSCPSSRELYFKVQGKSVNIDDKCLCDGNFKYLPHLAIPEFPKPDSTSDTAIHPIMNYLQYKQQDVSECNSTANSSTTYYNSSCGSVPVPGDNILYAFGADIIGRNLGPSDQNAVHWNTISGSVIKIDVACSGKDFCVLFRLTNSSNGICHDNPCKNDGIWAQNGLSSCICKCMPGFSGVDCSSVEQPCSDNPCCNGATCSNDGNGYVCTCPAGKTGSTCCNDIDYCTSNPCSVGATCISNSQSMTYECSCPPGKTGDTCADDIDYCASNPCSSGATCTSNSQLMTYECFCPPGKTGDTCADGIDYCASNPCSSGATCTSNSQLMTYECFCPLGKTGDTCADDIDYCASNPCSSGATCTSNSQLMTYKCFCPPGKTGDKCADDIDYCTSNPCSSGATCTSNSQLMIYECSCPPGKTGDTCADDIDYCAGNPCSSGATCTSDYRTLTFVCTCPSGKTGSTCGQDIDYCAGHPCFDGATCRSNSVLSTFECVCPPGKTGTTCNEPEAIDHCASNPCSNGATCTTDNARQTYNCSCPEGKTGRNCNTDDDSIVGAAKAGQDNVFPVLPVVYAVIGVIFIVVVITGIVALVYKRIYIPFKVKREERVVIPFDNQIRDESKHYNPMYFDCETSLAVGNATNEDSQLNIQSDSLLPKWKSSIAFSNPLYQLESKNDLQGGKNMSPMQIPSSDPDYEFIEGLQGGNSAASNGIYEEIPINCELEGSTTANDGSSLPQKSIYDTLKNEDVCFVSENGFTLQN